MGIRFFCPKGHKLNVKAFQAGKLGVCPDCGERVRIPLESTRPSRRAEKEQAVEEAAALLPETDDLHVEPDALGASISLKEVSLPEPVEAESIIISQPQPVADPEPQVSAAAPPTQPEPAPPEIPPEPPVEADPFIGASTAVWYVRAPAGGQYGPASSEVMRSWVEEGRVAEEALVWCEGWPEWKKAGDVFPMLAASAAGAPSEPVAVAAETAEPELRLDLEPTTLRPIPGRQSTKNSSMMLIVWLAVAVLVLACVFVWVLVRGGGVSEEPEASVAITSVEPPAYDCLSVLS